MHAGLLAHQESPLVAVILLPTVNPSMIAPGVIPLLVFVNVRAGGGQGMQLKQSFRKLLNPHQVSRRGRAR